MTTAAKEEVLGRIRSALGGRTGEDATNVQRAYEALPRQYARQSALSERQVIDLLGERLRDYDAEVIRVTGAEVSAVLASLIAGAVQGNVLIPADFPVQWRPELPQLVDDEGFEAAELDRFEAVITTATLAIADTGSFVLQATHGQGRRAVSLVPDVHLCVVRVEDVVQSVPEAFALLQNTASLPTTFVSGPSATADIEMTRIKGVHGPRSLYVLLVADSGTESAVHPSTDDTRTFDEQR